MSIWQTFRFFSSSPRIFVTSVPLSLRLFASKSQFCFGFVATMFWFIPLFSFLFWAKTSTKPFGKDGSDSIWQIAAALAMTGSTKSSAIGQFAKILLDWRWPQASSNGLIRALYDPFSFRFVSLNSAPAEYTRRREIEEKKLYDKIGNTQPSDSFVFAVISNKLSPHMKESCAVCTHQTTLISFSFVVVSLRRISSVCLSFFCLCWLIFVGFWTNRQDRIKLDYVFIFHLVCSLFFHSCIQTHCIRCAHERQSRCDPLTVWRRKSSASVLEWPKDKQNENMHDIGRAVQKQTKNRKFHSNEVWLGALWKEQQAQASKWTLKRMLFSFWNATANCELKKDSTIDTHARPYTLARAYKRSTQINVCSQLWKSKIRCHTQDHTHEYEHYTHTVALAHQMRSISFVYSLSLSAALLAAHRRQYRSSEQSVTRRRGSVQQTLGDTY